MYFFVTDETNVTPTQAAEYFIYGGLTLSDKQLPRVSNAIANIRKKYGFQDIDRLKFDTNSRPSAVTADAHREAKNAVIEACHAEGLRFIVQMIHHNIAKPENLTEYSLNTVLNSFNERFLRDHDDYGIVVIDRLPDGQAYSMLKNKFQLGLQFPGSGYQLPLDRVLMYATTCDGASNISSAVDIVLGAFRWVVNSQGKPTKNGTERTLFEKVARMLYVREKDGIRYARENGLILRPKEIKAPVYQERYDELVKYFVDLGS
ncbi:hypothetical protein ABZ342_33905 [Amycolatopsis sp. NPDC005961]|uniref:hypothetical protein n=1 Tax=Amycolatopsis sp. NPDC005961 TaxID=3156720 RepID=UPI0033CE302A